MIADISVCCFRCILLNAIGAKSLTAKTAKKLKKKTTSDPVQHFAESPPLAPDAKLSPKKRPYVILCYIDTSSIEKKKLIK
ncbi:hypothetical protein BSKO_05180 [Bryopsis sp. KO-2023]|nr:hypothetical protein BSKO_05180 [Bryopsis sp. KO-2023]